MRVCFDVDGTLIDYDDNPRDDIINLLKTLSNGGFNIVVWSGGGKMYAEHWVRKLSLMSYVEFCMAKYPVPPEGTVFTVDDQIGVDFGVPNLHVGPKIMTSDDFHKLFDQRARAVRMFL